MKIKSLIVAAAAIIVTAASCGLLKSAASTALSAGSSVGSALASIYAQYKADGKIDLSNLGNIVNLASIINILKGNALDGDNTDLIAGLIEGSQNTITPSNASAIVDLLGQISNIDLNKVTTTAKTLTNNATQEATQAAAASLASSPEVQSALNTLTSIFRLMN